MIMDPVFLQSANPAYSENRKADVKIADMSEY